MRNWHNFSVEDDPVYMELYEQYMDERRKSYLYLGSGIKSIERRTKPTEKMLDLLRAMEAHLMSRGF